MYFVCAVGTCPTGCGVWLHYMQPLKWGAWHPTKHPGGVPTVDRPLTVSRDRRTPIRFDESEPCTGDPGEIGEIWTKTFGLTHVAWS